MNIFLDTSVLIEHIKGNKIGLIERLIIGNNRLFINSIVYSEFLYHFISIVSGKSPFTIKQKKEVKKLLELYEPIDFLNQFEFLPDNNEIKDLSYKYMKTYNLLPNDSIILATCKYYQIKAIATYDNDLKDILFKENIKLIE